MEKYYIIFGYVVLGLFVGLAVKALFSDAGDSDISSKYPPNKEQKHE